MMKFFPVAALTASAIIVMSASLKFGVIFCWDCCAFASEGRKTQSAAHAPARTQAFAQARARLTAKKPDTFIRNSLGAGSPALFDPPCLDQSSRPGPSTGG